MHRSLAAFLLLTLAATLVTASCTAFPWMRPHAPGQAYGPGMMGGIAVGPHATNWTPSGPGDPGFVAGTTSAPRVVGILAGPGPRFVPADVRVTAGETVTFEVTTMGPTVHEFKVGPLEAVDADSDAAPEIADIGMMQTKSLTYTFSGPGPFGFACHEPGHFEAGMTGTITVVGSI